MGPLRLEDMLHVLQTNIHGLANPWKRKGLANSPTVRQIDPTLTQFFMCPYISLHANTVIGMLPEKSQPNLNGFRIAILNLDQASEGDSLEIFLAFLEYKTTSRNSPSLGDSRQRHWPRSRKVEVISRPESEVGEEFKISYAVGT